MWARYKNGNSVISINLDNGTKIRETKDDDFNLDFPESLDIACTSYCTAGCPYCYANCSINGKHADIMNAKFIDTLRPFTEAALQFNDLSHPDMIPFLEKLKARRVIANITVNQIHFEEKEGIIDDLVKHNLVKGIGVSLQKPTREFINNVKKYSNAVIHTINGILSPDDIEMLRDNDLKILILGYKDLGRGANFAKTNEKLVKARQRYLYDVLKTLPEHFKCVCFDNLSLEQLNVKRIMTEDEWNKTYMGDEGTSSMFIDLVKQKFGISSLCEENEMFPIMDNVDDMFAIVKKKARKTKSQ